MDFYSWKSASIFMLQFVQAALSNNIFAGLSFAKKKKETRKEKKDAKGFWTIMLTDWLKNFVPEFLTNQNLKPKLIVDYSPTFSRLVPSSGISWIYIHTKVLNG